MAERPDLKQAQTTVRASEVNVKLQKSLAFPEIHITGSYDKAGSFIDNYFSVGFNMTLPLFNQNQGNIRAAKATVMQTSQHEQYARE